MASKPQVEDPIDREIRIRTAPAWLPPVGSRLTSTVVTIRIGQSEWGVYPVLIVEDANGTMHSIHAFHTLLRNQLKELRPMPGTLITVAYIGKVTRTEDEVAKGKNEYHNYVVIAGDGSDLLTQEGTFSWDEL